MKPVTDTRAAAQTGVLQRLFDRFYTAGPPVKVAPDAARTALSNLQAVFALDALPLANGDLRRLADDLADSAVLVGADSAGPDTLLRLRLGGLSAAEAAALCAGAAQIDGADATTSSLLAQIAALLDNLPLPVQLAGRLIRRAIDAQLRGGK